MECNKTPTPTSDATHERARFLFAEHQQRIYRHTDRMFAGLMLFQWAAGIAAAFWLSSRTWEGANSHIHFHVWAAVFLGGLITLYPVLLAAVRPGTVITRQSIAIGQLLMSGLLIHLTGGRIETHFHVFGSLAFLAVYRDWRVLLSATVVTIADHFLRGFLWPQSVYGVQMIEPWRWLEHAGWVIFEDVFLILSCVVGSRELWGICVRDAKLEQSNSELERQAFHDALSGLPNRILFYDRVEHALARIRRQNGVIAVMFIDLDNFKLINDSLGHEQGDRLLVEVAHRLQECVRQEDTVARMGGDEFTILLEGIETEDEAVEAAERVVERLNKSVWLATRDVVISSSIGIAISTHENDQAETLLRNADAAMYQAKLNGKAGYVVFDRSMNDRLLSSITEPITMKSLLV